ncbi:hypothetical protein [Enterobacter sp. H2G27]
MRASGKNCLTGKLPVFNSITSMPVSESGKSQRFNLSPLAVSLTIGFSFPAGAADLTVIRPEEELQLTVGEKLE